MAKASMIGTRIRERRVMAGLKQADLARRAGISASYLNLIEHNRRRIGGKTLNRLAEELSVPAALLAEGAQANVIAALRAAAGRAEQSRLNGLAPGVEKRADQATHPAPNGIAERAPGNPGEAPPAETARIEEFAGRFPGWAGLLATLAAQRDELETTVTALTERLAHDPHLSASLHEVISTVTAIRSTAAILADTQALEPEWQARFHRNLNEDSQRLAGEAEALARYLEGAPDAQADIASPQDELHAFLEAHAFHFSALEGAGGTARVASVVARSEHLQSEAARGLAGAVLKQYVRDARRLPLAEMEAALEAHGLDPAALCATLGVGMAQLFRRLAMLPEPVTGPVGLVICDSAGALLLRKPVLGFSVPRAAGACGLWPLFALLAQPSAALRLRLVQGEARVLALAASQEVAAANFERPALHRPHMLLLPDPGEAAAGPARRVGASCRVCSLAECPARREPSLLAGAF